MRKLLGIVMVLGIASAVQAQKLETPYKSKTLAPTYDTIHIDSVSINASFFKVLDATNTPIPSEWYEVNFPKSKLIFKKKLPLAYRFDSHSLP